MRYFLLTLYLLAATSSAQARTVPAGTLSGGVLIGPSFKTAPLLGGANAYFTLAVQGEYMIDSAFSALADLDLGLSSSIPLRFHAGARYRFGSTLPVSPFIQAQVTVGHMWGVIGASLPLYGGRIALGGDYFLTKEIALGLLLGYDMMTTTGARPAYYGDFDVLVYSTYAFD